jgi:lipopolysaccharide/colanic/teichoic acid biosynthesis glycosyltransferase
MSGTKRAHPLANAANREAHMSTAVPGMTPPAQAFAIAIATATNGQRSSDTATAGMNMLASAWSFVSGVADSARPITEDMRRLRDIAGSLLLLVLTLPVMLVAACLIKFESPGPVLYRQERVGLFGQVFTLLKFRSMRVDAEADGPCWAAKRDHRVTRIGKFIRACRIDELPQLVNVLRGEMSLVGPRPERPYFTEKLTPFIPGYHQRTRILPGITGLAQVSYRYGASVEDARAKHTYDVYYLRNQTMLLDLRIMLATVWVVLCRIGAR